MMSSNWLLDEFCEVGYSWTVGTIAASLGDTICGEGMSYNPFRVSLAPSGVSGAMVWLIGDSGLLVLVRWTGSVTKWEIVVMGSGVVSQGEESESHRVIYDVCLGKVCRIQ